MRHRPVDGHVPCDRPNRALEFEGPPIFCSLVEYRRMAKAQQAKLWLIGRAPSRNRKLFVPRSLTGCSFASLSPCDRVPRRDRSVRSQRPGLSHLLPRPEITAPRLFACGSPAAQRPGCRSPSARRPGSDSDGNSAPIFRL
jgi:hypothetical protein